VRLDRQGQQGRQELRARLRRSPKPGKDANGVVHLRGVAKMDPVLDSIIFELPAGYRPASSSTFRVVNDISHEMTVTIYDRYVQIGGYPGNVGFGSGPYRFWLDGISFRLT
jgi:hypothetical protein